MKKLIILFLSLISVIINNQFNIRMNREYIDKLVRCKRVGKLIKLCDDNLYYWSTDDYRYLFQMLNITSCLLLQKFMYYHDVIHNYINYFFDKILIPQHFAFFENNLSYNINIKCSRYQEDILTRKIKIYTSDINTLDSIQQVKCIN